MKTYITSNFQIVLDKAGFASLNRNNIDLYYIKSDKFDPTIDFTVENDQLLQNQTVIKLDKAIGVHNMWPVVNLLNNKLDQLKIVKEESECNNELFVPVELQTQTSQLLKRAEFQLRVDTMKNVKEILFYPPGDSSSWITQAMKIVQVGVYIPELQ